jgi:ketosteroid isomerase-like protein
MSQENVDVVRTGYALLREGGPTSAAEGLERLVEANCEFDFSAAYIDGPVLRGLAEAREFGRRGVWAGSINFEPEEFLDIDAERVLVLIRFRATAESSGVPVEARPAHLVTLRDGRVRRIKVYADRAEALQAVGLSE